ncbi:hypothetical protein TWF506_000504 [Arthrobotrys conoides]|uniref:Uncharacterized protein n=1 Tax=Arthrobotrys conoides TaxID=74498 RepID=A0AAN8NE20_9PEZI
MEKAPSEIHVQILRYLSSPDVLGTIQALPSIILSNILNWNLSFFGIEQLLILHRYLEEDESLVSAADGLVVKKKILQTLRGEFRKLADKVSNIREDDKNASTRDHKKESYLEHSLLNCYFDDIKAVVSEIEACKTKEPQESGFTVQDEIANQFLKTFHYRNKIVQEFCETVATVDPHGGTCRYDRIKPDQETFFKHLLFWRASDYIRNPGESPKPLSQRVIADRWKTFLHRIGAVFGPDTETSLRDCVLAKSVILLKYRDYTAAHASANAYNNHQTFRKMLINSSLDVEDVSTFMLLQGLDIAYNFFHEDVEAINIVISREAREIGACKTFWTNFEEPDLQ